MQFCNTPGPEAIASLSGTRHSFYWLDRADRPTTAPELVGADTADLLVVGAGFTGLWTALLAKQADPGRDVVLVEGGRAADGASGRNGGFVASSLTHGFANGMERWPDDMPTLLRLGRENLDAIEKAVGDLGIDCDFVRAGELDVAVEPHQVEGLRSHADAAARMGESTRFLDAGQVRAMVDSPTYLAGSLDRDGVALVDPARLAWGLRRACMDAGVRLYERTPDHSA